tara:strand:- start:6026 stop:6667 length:642 start_codon:yes stop_codon:yes gene_type:complete
MPALFQKGDFSSVCASDLLPKNWKTMTPLIYGKLQCIENFNAYLGNFKLSARLFSKNNLTALFPFFEACEEFIMLVFNHNKTELEAKNFIRDLPKNHTYDNKLPVGIYNDEGVLIAVLDLIRDYPSQNSWYIGLLLTLPSLRKRGIGAIIVGCVEQTIASFGANQLNLIVQETNHQALTFWQKHGYYIIHESLQELDECTHIVLHLQKRILHR